MYLYIQTDGLYEIRVKQGSDIFRIFCFFDEGELIVLANGFQKKTQKTPKSEIEKALKIKKECEQVGNEQDISLAMATANLYQLKKDKAEEILHEMHQQISTWRTVARKFAIGQSEIEQTKRAFRLVSKD